MKLFGGIPYMNTISNCSKLYDSAYQWTDTYDNYKYKQHYDEAAEA